MAEEFCTGLRYEIRMTLASHGGLSYTEALGRALDIEAAMPGEKTGPAVNHAPPPAKSQASMDKRKWEEPQAHPEPKRGGYGPSKPQGGRYQTTPGSFKGNTPKSNSCPKCNRLHDGICKSGTDGCFNCGKTGHFAKRCPNETRGTGAKPHPSAQRLQLCAMNVQPGLNLQQTPRNQ